MKFIIYFILLIFFILIQISLAPYFGILKYLNLPFCYLIIYRLLGKKYFLFYIILTGLILDFFSIFPKGFYSIVFLLFGLLINWLADRFRKIHLINLFIAAISSGFYQIIILVVNQILYLFKITQYPIIFNKAYFNQLGFFIVFNSIIIFLITELWLIRSKLKA